MGYTCQNYWKSEGDNIVPDYRLMTEDFNRHGYNVTEEALKHNYSAFEKDMKSGYLDKEKGYFLFTPCSCNALQFYAEFTNGEKYQQTYEG